jgi:outer membrane protein
MKRLVFISILGICLTASVTAQEKAWTMEECMQYAISNSPAVRKKTFEQEINKAEYTSAIANFFPSLDVGANARYNYGRSIDPETNTYKETTTFNNYYNGEANLPLFSGGQLINQWRSAKLNRQSGMNAIQKAKDDLALKVMQAYIDVVYYKGLMRYTSDKLEESRKNLHRSQRLVELGLKGKADLAQIEAEVANDDYLCTLQQNRYDMAISTLKEYMNYPIGEELEVGTVIIDSTYQPLNESVDDIYDYAQENNPTALQAGFDLRNSELKHLIQKGKLFPTIALYAGVNTSYFENLKSDVAPKSFNTQFKNNMGEYFGVSVRIPLFNRLNTVTEVRRARNNVRIAEETQSEILRQLQTAIEKAVLDREGYAKEITQMEKKLQAEDYSYQVTSRKYEEGLASSLDLRTSANLLLESQANLLHRKLMYLLKCKEVDYYKGVPLVIEN